MQCFRTYIGCLHYWHFSSPDHQPDSSSVQVARCFLGELRFHSEKRPLSLHCCIQDTWPSGKGITQTEVIYTHYSAENADLCLAGHTSTDNPAAGQPTQFNPTSYHHHLLRPPQSLLKSSN
uniref:Uncharacterized protein n=1 Tax=Neolamprologus brichardi TaxID=32507 RepID=A0A3Q4M365_NEOBR